MSTFSISVSEAQTFFLVLARTGGIIFSAPVFDNRNIPLQIKIGLCLAMTSILIPSVEFTMKETSVFGIMMAVAAEAAIGLILGLGTQILFSAIDLAGQVVGFQMGLGMVSVIDPFTQNQTSVITQFKNLVGILLFFAFDIHHLFIKAVAKSYQLIPLDGIHANNSLLVILLKITREMFEIGLKIGAPVMAINLFVSVGLGVIARTVPQMNVFVEGFPIKIAVGLLTLGLSIPFWSMVLKKTFFSMGDYMNALLRAMQ